MIFVIDDDEVMAGCVANACKGKEVITFTNAVEAMNALSGDELPELIFLDVLLDGPDGFTFLNEIVSYTDTAKIPVVIVSSLDLKEQKLSEYGVVGYLNKEKMKPKEILEYADKYAG